jgi:aminoglycoside 3-N-acetyltransferase
MTGKVMTMQEKKLFLGSDGNWVCNTHLMETLEVLGAHEPDVLYIHSELSFGQPNPELGKRGLLEALLETLQELKVGTLCFPTFTFSFCNGKDFNVQQSKSKMGALNEFARKQGNAIRSVDPLMSNVVIGEEQRLVQDVGHQSIGDECTFDKLHRHLGDVRFLFLGASLGKCFTYMHYIEEREKAPYRYNRDFTGVIFDGEKRYEDTYSLFVRYNGVLPDPNASVEEDLLKQELLRKVPLGDSALSCITEKAAYAAIRDSIAANLEYIIVSPSPHEQQDTHFQVENMVAL